MMVEEAISVDRAFPIRGPTWAAYKQLLIASTTLGALRIVATGGTADWSDTLFSIMFYNFALARLLGACHVLRPAVTVALRVDTCWRSTDVNAIQVISSTGMRVEEFAFRNSVLSAPQFAQVSHEFKHLRTLHLEHVVLNIDLAAIAALNASSFAHVRVLTLSYNRIDNTGPPGVLAGLLRHLAPQLEECGISCPRAFTCRSSAALSMTGSIIPGIACAPCAPADF